MSTRDWWKTFFDGVTGDLMFKRLAPARTRREVEQVLRKSGVRPGARILDLGCGRGRHVLEFARRGFETVGLDYSRNYAQAARNTLRKAGLAERARILRGDMRDLSGIEPESFDLVVSLFNSFGYFEKRAEDRRVLREVARVLRPGGALVLNTLNLAGVRHHLVDLPAERREDHASWWDDLGGDRFVLDHAAFDPKRRRTHCLWVTIDVRRRSVKRYPFTQNVYSPQDFRKMLKPLGLRVEALWGRLHGEHFEPRRSWHQTFVARKR